MVPLWKLYLFLYSPAVLLFAHGSLVEALLILIFTCCALVAHGSLVEALLILIFTGCALVAHGSLVEALLILIFTGCALVAHGSLVKAVIKVCVIDLELAVLGEAHLTRHARQFDPQHVAMFVRYQVHVFVP